MQLYIENSQVATLRIGRSRHISCEIPMRTKDFPGSIALFPLVLAFAGCTTMDMLGDAGESFEEGNVGTGIFMGLTGLVFGPLLDVVTLGGTLEGDEISKTWEAGLDSYAAIKGDTAPAVSRAAMPGAAPVAIASASDAYVSSSYAAPQVAAATQVSEGSRPSGGFVRPEPKQSGQVASSSTVKPRPVAPRVAVSVVRQRYITTTPNQYEVVLQNVGNVRIACRVSFQYQYPDGRGGLAWDSVVKPVGPIAVGGTGVAVAGGAAKNIANVRWKNTCEQWAHDR